MFLLLYYVADVSFKAFVNMKLHHRIWFDSVALLISVLHCTCAFVYYFLYRVILESRSVTQ